VSRYFQIVLALLIEKPDTQTVSEGDIQLLRQDLRSQKKQLIAANLTLTDAEPRSSGQCYDQFSADMTKLGDQKYVLIKEYAQNFGSLTDEQAKNLINRSLALEKLPLNCGLSVYPSSIGCCRARRQPPSSRWSAASAR